MKVHLVDGTYELFRAHFGAPEAKDPATASVGATIGILRTLIVLLRDEGATHVACAFDHVIESFRNDLYPGYKTSAGVPVELLSQFDLAERATHALGIVVWPMVELEADDALATGAARFADAPGVDQVVICTPDKDLYQCVRGERVVLHDRRRKRVIDEAAARARFGIAPASVPDWLALVGDSADGYPGLPGWGEKSASAVLARFASIEAIPDEARDWQVDVARAGALAACLRARRAEAALYKRLATLRTDAPLAEGLADLEWRGARRAEMEALCREIGAGDVLGRVPRWRD